MHTLRRIKTKTHMRERAYTRKRARRSLTDLDEWTYTFERKTTRHSAGSQTVKLLIITLDWSPRNDEIGFEIKGNAEKNPARSRRDFNDTGTVKKCFRRKEIDKWQFSSPMFNALTIMINADGASTQITMHRRLYASILAILTQQFMGDYRILLVTKIHQARHI